MPINRHFFLNFFVKIYQILCQIYCALFKKVTKTKQETVETVETVKTVNHDDPKDFWSSSQYQSTITGEHGFDYQEEVALYSWLMLTLLKIQKYTLYYEVSGLHKFDDIAFIFEWNNTQCAFFLQTKHRVTDREKFNTKEFIESFLKASAAKRMSQLTVDCVRFIFITTATTRNLDHVEECSNSKNNKEFEEFFQNFMTNNTLIHQLGPENRDIIQKALDGRSLEEEKAMEDYYMKNIVIVTSCPELEQIRKINNELIKELHSDGNCDRLFNILRKNFLTAIGASSLGKTTTRNILTENNLLLQNSILEAFLEQTTQEFLEKISSWMEFKEDFLRHFKNQRIFGFRDKKNLATLLTYQTVRRDKQEVYIVSQIHSLQNFNKNVVVVVEDSHIPKELFKNENLTFVVKEDSEAKAVCNVEQLYIFQLTEESRTKFMSEKLKIQNMSLTISDLEEYLQKFVSNSEMFEILDTILDRIVEKFGKIQLGKPLPSDDVAKIYFSRKAPFVRINPGNVNDLLDEEDLVSGSKNYIIMGDPGTGKTFAMKYIAMRSKETNPAMWVEYIDLKLHSKLFEKNPVEQFSTGESKNFLLNNLISSGGDKSLDHKTLKSYLNSGHNVPVLLIFDGFDEVVPSYEIKILNLISKFVECGIRVFASSRFHCIKSLQTLKSFDKIRIKPYDSDSEKQLLLRYLRNELTSKNYEEEEGLLDNFCSKIVEGFIKSTRLATPMVIKMLAKIFLKDFKKYCETRDFELHINHEDTTVITIYNKIYEMCFENFSEKAGGDADNNLKKLIIVDEMNQYRRIYGDLAYRDLRRSLVELPGVTEVHLPPVEVTLTDGQRALLLAQGFVVLINGDFRFVHRTFAEFFHSDLLVERLKEGDDNVINYLSTLPFDRVSEFLYLQTMEKIINENFPIVSMIQDDAVKYKKFCKFLKIIFMLATIPENSNLFRMLNFMEESFTNTQIKRLRLNNIFCDLISIDREFGFTNENGAMLKSFLEKHYGSSDASEPIRTNIDTICDVMSYSRRFKQHLMERGSATNERLFNDMFHSVHFSSEAGGNYIEQLRSSGMYSTTEAFSRDGIEIYTRTYPLDCPIDEVADRNVEVMLRSADNTVKAIRRFRFGFKLVSWMKAEYRYLDLLHKYSRIKICSPWVFRQCMEMFCELGQDCGYRNIHTIFMNCRKYNNEQLRILLEDCLMKINPDILQLLRTLEENVNIPALENGPQTNTHNIQDILIPLILPIILATMYYLFF